MKIRDINAIPLVLLLLLPVFSLAQYLDNPSFEGPPGISISPPTWSPFDPGAHPTQNLLNVIIFRLLMETAYLTLVAHGSSSGRPNVLENCQATLTNPLLKGRCYTLSLDLASRDDLGHYEWGDGFIYYRASTSLKIYGSNNISEKGELIAETTAVTNVNWENLSFTIKPENEIRFLILQVSLAEGVRPTETS